MLRGIVTLAAGTCTVARPACAQPPSAPTSCSVSAHLSDPDPAGTNVRAGPSATARVVAHIPHERAEGGDSFAPELEIVGFARGWAKVRAVRFADYGEGETLLFDGPGWISGRLLSSTLTRMPVLRRPVGSADAAGAAAPDTAVIQSIDDCLGPFAHVVVRLASGRRVVGWTRGLCANQATTCS